MNRMNGSRLPAGMVGAVLIGWPKPVHCKNCKKAVKQRFSISPVMSVVQCENGSLEFSPTPEVEIRCMICGTSDFVAMILPGPESEIPSGS